MFSTDQKGAIAEAAIVQAAIRLGIGVLKPVTDFERYDLVFDLRPKLVRVQCKWAALCGDVIVIRCRSSRRGREGHVHRSYTPDEIDAFAGYCAALDRCYYLPIEAFPRRAAIQLRLTRTRNNQARGVLRAESFEFEATLGSGRSAGP